MTQNLDLTACDREPIHLIGSVQSYGGLLIADEATGQITGCSENFAQFHGDFPSDLTGVSINDLFDPELLQRLEEDTARSVDVRALATTALQGRDVEIIHHRSRGRRYLEIAPWPDPMTSHLEQLRRLQDGLAAMAAASTVVAIGEAMCRAVAGLTGFDRVKAYRFHPDFHGEVIAEECRGDFDRYLGLHFPASDIPKQARRLYLTNRMRQIADVTAEVSPIHALNGESPEDFDLSDVFIRSVSPIHLQYLHNMGVGASLSVSIIVDGQLWGLIACHHRTPKRTTFDIMRSCDSLAAAMAARLSSWRAQSNVTDRERIRELQTAVVKRIGGGRLFLESLRGVVPQLMEMINARGAALVTRDTIETFGSTPTKKQLSDLVAHLLKNFDNTDLLVTDRITDIYPQGDVFRHTACGIVVAAVSRARHSMLMWFRPAAEREIAWGGDPEKPVSLDQHGLTPRSSFAIWRETVKDRSLPWLDSELARAEDVRIFIVDVVIERALALKILDDTNHTLERRNQDLELFTSILAHDLKEPIRAVNQVSQLLAPMMETQKDENASRLMTMLRNNATRMHSMLQDLISYTQLGKKKNQAEMVNMPDLLENTIATVNAPCTFSITFVSDMQDCMTYATPLSIILQNLVRNAVDHHHRDRGAVQIEVGYNLHRNGLHISVDDDGPGIDQDRRSRVFQPFQSSRQGNGRGMGLANVKRLVDAHEGDITIEDSTLGGARFLIKWPLVRRIGL